MIPANLWLISISEASQKGRNLGLLFTQKLRPDADKNNSMQRDVYSNSHRDIFHSYNADQFSF